MGAFVLLVAAVVGGPPATVAPLEVPPPVRIWTPVEAVQAAAADLSQFAPGDAPHQFYLFARDTSDRFADALTFALNTGTSTANVALQATRLHDGRLFRIDLRDWIPRTADRVRFESIAASYVDPFFYVSSGSVQDIGQLSADLLMKGAEFTKWPPEVVRVAGGFSEVRTTKFELGGRVWDRQRVRTEKLTAALQAVQKGRPVFSAAIVANAPVEVAQLAAVRSVAIVDAERWLVRSLSTTDGGLYYDLQGFRGLSQKQWLDKWGADIDSAREASEYVGLFESGVTFQPRRLVYAVGRYIRQSSAYPLVVITEDVAEGSFDTLKHPIYSLGDGFSHDAVEAIAMRSNGLQAYALFDGAGVLQDEAPPEIAADRRQARGSTRLQAAIGCIRCHGDNDGWQGAENHVQALFDRGPGGQLRPFADLGGPPDQASQLVEIAEKYSGDLGPAIQRARDDMHRAVFRMTGGRSGAETMAAVAAIYERYALGPISPQVAALELGVQCTSEQAPAVFAQLVPPLPPDPSGLSQEDISIHTIRRWGTAKRLHVNRLTWEANYQATLSRVLTSGVFP